MRPIDADALFSHLEQLSEVYNEWHDRFEDGDHQKSIMYGKFTAVIETMLHIKRKMATLDCTPVARGEWVHDINNLYGCSECLERETMSRKKLKKFCPNCGAKMDGGKSE